MQTISKASTYLLLAILTILATVPAVPAFAAEETPPADATLVPDAKRLNEETAAIVARALLRQIRRDLAAVEEEIRDHPYLERLERGEASLDNLRAFVGEEYSIIRSDLRSDFRLVARFGADPASRAFYQNLANGEVIALDLLLDFAAALGLSEEDLAAYEPLPGGQAFPAYVATLASQSNTAEVAAAFLVNFAVFGENTGRMRDALMSQYGFSAEDVAFFDFFATPIPGFENDGVAVMVEGLLDGAEPRAIRRAARLLQAYELLFWDAVGEVP